MGADTSQRFHKSLYQKTWIFFTTIDVLREWGKGTGRGDSAAAPTTTWKSGIQLNKIVL